MPIRFPIDTAVYGSTLLAQAGDMRARLQAAFAAALANHGKLTLGAGTFNITSNIAINVQTGQMELAGAGMDSTVINISDVPFGSGVALAFGSVWTIVQNTGVNVTLSAQVSPADANAGSQLAVTPAGSGALFAVGDYIQLRDPNENTAGNQNGRWIVQVQSIAGDTLILEQSAPLIFPIGTTISRRGQDNHSLFIHDLTIQCGAAGTPTNVFQLMALNGYRDVIIGRVRFKNSQSALVWNADCINVLYEDCIFEDADGSSSSNGLVFQGCTAPVGKDNMFRRCRFAIAGQQSPYTHFYGNRAFGGMRHAVDNLGGRALKINAGSAYSDVHDNHSNDFGSPDVVYDSPFSHYHHNMVKAKGVIGGGFYSAAHGVWVGSNIGAPPTGSDHCEVDNNTFEECGGYAVVAGGGSTVTAAQYLKIHDNIGRNCGQGFVLVGVKDSEIYNNLNDGCGLQNADLTKGGIYELPNAVNNRYHDNKLRNAAGVVPINTTAGTAPAFLGPNEFTGATVQPTWKQTDMHLGADVNNRLDIGDPGNNATIPTQGYHHVTITPTAAETGGILQPGADGQEIIIHNEAGGAFTFAWAGAGSNVAGAAGATIGSSTQARFIYDRKSAFWFRGS